MTPFLMMAMLLAADEKPAPTPIVPAKWDRKEPVSYEKDVKPLFAAKCMTCHSGKETKGQYSMDSHAAVLKGGKKGVAVVAGKPTESMLYLRSSHMKTPVMPPASEANDLTETEVALLKAWIEQGAAGPSKPEVKTRPVVVLTLPAASVKPVRALAFNPAGTTLAVARGNVIYLLDAKSGDIAATLTDANLKTADGKPANAAHVSLVESIAFSPDGKTLASGSFREVTLWDLESKTPKHRLSGFADKVVALTWNPDGTLLATAGGAPTEDGEIRLFTSDGKLKQDLKSPHSDTVFGIAFSPDGKMLASGGADKFVRVFDVVSGKLLKSFEGHTQHVLDVGFGPDNNRIVSAGADDLIKIWDFAKGEKARDLKGHTKQVTRLAFAGKSVNFYTVSGDNSARRWSVETGDPSKSFTDAKDYLYAIAANADGTMIATGGEEGLVRIIDTKAATVLKTVAFGAK
ncbi:hypothetical protein BH11PLA2_BH11PLA2_41120 [soil metagenome]